MIMVWFVLFLASEIQIATARIVMECRYIDSQCSPPSTSIGAATHTKKAGTNPSKCLITPPLDPRMASAGEIGADTLPYSILPSLTVHIYNNLQYILWIDCRDTVTIKLWQRAEY